MAPTDAEALKALNTLVDTATTLLQQLQTILGGIQKNESPSRKKPSNAESKKTDTTSTTTSASTDSPPSSSTGAIDALALARDSTSLIKAHATKISLFIINEPFTPSAISTVIRQLVTGPIPGLASSLEICDSNTYTSVLRRELAWRAQKVFVELGGLLQRIPKDGKILSGDKKDSFGPGGKGSLASTGLLWAACDDVVGLANMGVGGFFVKKAEEWRDTLKDVMEEMKEWGDEEPEDDDDDDDGNDDKDVKELTDKLEETSLSKQEMLDDFMNSQESIPRNDPDGIRPRLESSLKRLRLIVLLYQAIAKRRFKKLPSFPPKTANADLPQRLDKVAEVLQQLPDKFGDLAAAFYDLDPEEIDKAMAEAFSDAIGVSELLSKNWNGERDEFTEWTEKFQAEIKK
ncbi:hypothetical protein AK830_g6338 [Neonectria ditissima]|uniref:Cyclin-D1-binding protein 1-like N-terminal domain-containing protein n=1 Tax=Neonectria ditissima TaxID=78410 RepID=A0A0P7BIN0_9HYPO|nr:hypothetical protein AK830_g6338 [Neonectria ditissima]